MKRLLGSILLILMLPAALGSNIASAAVSSESYTAPSSAVNSTKDQLSMPTEIEALYPMPLETEAALIHAVPACPVNIDGAWFKAEEINLFDGQRLRFTVNKAGELYAFTTAKGLETFVESEYGESAWTVKPDAITDSGFVDSFFYADWWYGGLNIVVPPGTHLPSIGVYNDIFSSARICDSAAVYVYEHINYGGDYFYMPAGSTWTMLTFQGWNDRISSIWAL